MITLSNRIISYFSSLIIVYTVKPKFKKMDLHLKIPPAILTLIIAAGMWWIEKYISLSWAEFESSLWLVVVFLVVGGLFGILGLAAFYQNRTSIDPHKPHRASSLVTGGIYSISRNPMYVALLLVLGAYGFYLGNGLTLILLPVFVGYMNCFQIAPEEQAMEEKFGEEYQKYKSGVRRWL